LLNLYQHHHSGTRRRSPNKNEMKRKRRFKGGGVGEIGKGDAPRRPRCAAAAASFPVDAERRLPERQEACHQRARAAEVQRLRTRAWRGVARWRGAAWRGAARPTPCVRVSERNDGRARRIAASASAQR